MTAMELAEIALSKAEFKMKTMYWGNSGKDRIFFIEAIKDALLEAEAEEWKRGMEEAAFICEFAMDIPTPWHQNMASKIRAAIMKKVVTE